MLRGLPGVGSCRSAATSHDAGQASACDISCGGLQASAQLACDRIQRAVSAGLMVLECSTASRGEPAMLRQSLSNTGTVLIGTGKLGPAVNTLG